MVTGEDLRRIVVLDLLSKRQVRQARLERLAAIVAASNAHASQMQRVDAATHLLHTLAKQGGNEAAAAQLAEGVDLVACEKSYRALKAPRTKGPARGPDVIRTSSGTLLKRCRANPALYGIADDDDEPADLSGLLKRQTFGRGTLRPFVGEDESAVKSVAVLSGRDQVGVDEREMSARFLISTSGVDRVGDIVRQRGLDWTDYAKNAIVLWNHGQSPLIPFPLGTSKNPLTGKLSVEVTDSATYATCWFGKGVAQSEDMFKLVCSGIVQAASIHMVAPIQAKARTAAGPNGRPGYDIMSASVGEWSLVDIPCNADACRRAAATKRLFAEPLCDDVCELLDGMVRDYLPQARGHVQGWGG